MAVVFGRTESLALVLFGDSFYCFMFRTIASYIKSFEEEKDINNSSLASISSMQQPSIFAPRSIVGRSFEQENRREAALKLAVLPVAFSINTPHTTGDSSSFSHVTSSLAQGQKSLVGYDNS